MAASVPRRSSRSADCFARNDFLRLRLISGRFVLADPLLLVFPLWVGRGARSVPGAPIRVFITRKRQDSMLNIRSPWILMLLFSAVSSSASAQDAGGPIARLVSRLREPSHTHQHVHAVPAAPVYDYTYSQTQAVDPGSPAEAAPAVAPAAESTYDAAYAASGDPYGFTAILNRIRASAGLHPLVYDPTLSSWAQQNNAAQCQHGLGHHINPAGIQNCAYNYSDANAAAEGWMNSPGHRRNMLSPSATHFGIAFGPGPYWTLNAR